MAKIKGGYLQKCLSCEELFGAKEKGISYCPKCRIDLLREKRMGKIQKKEKRTCPQCGNIFFNKAKRPSTQEWQELVEYCLERDNFKCTECDSDINLVIHHIIPIYRCGSKRQDISNKGFVTIDVDTFKPNNLKTVCERCHQKLHLLLNSE